MSKMTKALYPKRPALIPVLDSMVQTYLRDDDLGAQPSAAGALALASCGALTAQVWGFTLVARTG